MSKYYFDIETFSRGEKPNPLTDKIISIQFQLLDDFSGKAIDELVILKEWESSEKEIVKSFFPMFKPWNFIPVGNNLSFERRFLKQKFDEYLGINATGIDYNFPEIDIQSILVMMNKGQFKGCGIHNFSNKKFDGSSIKPWYEKQEFDKIEEYIKNEAESFIQLYSHLCKMIPEISLKPKE